jgi:hypothetical protein
MKFRKLRILWSVLCGLACVLLIVLWVRSYWRTEEVFGPLAGPYNLGIDSMRGRLTCHVGSKVRLAKWQYMSGPLGNVDWHEFEKRIPHWSFGPMPGPAATDETALIVPHWFYALVSALLTFAPWIRRFSYVGACQVATGFTCLCSVG